MSYFNRNFAYDNGIKVFVQDDFIPHYELEPDGM